MALGVFPPDVIAAAQAAEAKWKIPASVTLAQWAIESAWGKAEPKGSNNPFGIKAAAGQPFVACPTHEEVGGRLVPATARFCRYDSLADAFDAHGKLLATLKPYAHARSLLPDAYAFAEALTGVYATDHLYGTKLRQIMKAHELLGYDSLVKPSQALPPVAAPAFLCTRCNRTEAQARAAGCSLHPCPLSTTVEAVPVDTHAAAPKKLIPTARPSRGLLLAILAGLALVAWVILGAFYPAAAQDMPVVASVPASSPNAGLWAWLNPIIFKALASIITSAIVYVAAVIGRYLHVALTAQQESRLRDTLLTGAHVVIATAEAKADTLWTVDQRNAAIKSMVDYAFDRMPTPISFLGFGRPIVENIATKMLAEALSKPSAALAAA